ncbi:MAG: dephospho-CoA kinase [Lachnospiraceae bacterium]|nr:dephospho-CoA kinase [Lachnospiraceae bacterium]
MYVIGLTGGVGSGKTKAANMLAEIAGAQLLIADKLGHQVMKKGEVGYQKIVECFGDGILDGQGEIARDKLSCLVFSNEDKLKKLNAIIHPAVKGYLEDYIRERKGKTGYLVLETALMFETGCDLLCDEVWYVYVPSSLRKERLASQRGYSSQKCEEIMENQFSEEEFFRRCRHVIKNDGSLLELERQLRELLFTDGSC